MKKKTPIIELIHPKLEGRLLISGYRPVDKAAYRLYQKKRGDSVFLSYSGGRITATMDTKGDHKVFMTYGHHVLHEGKRNVWKIAKDKIKG